MGSFDGLHAGHRKLIKSVVEDNLYTPTIASFWPHPREVLYKETRLRLDLPEEKLPILEDLGIEQLVMIPFDKKLANLSAENFVRDILINQLLDPFLLIYLFVLLRVLRCLQLLFLF